MFPPPLLARTRGWSSLVSCARAAPAARLAHSPPRRMAARHHRRRPFPPAEAALPVVHRPAPTVVVLVAAAVGSTVAAQSLPHRRSRRRMEATPGAGLVADSTARRPPGVGVGVLVAAAAAAGDLPRLLRPNQRRQLRRAQEAPRRATAEVCCPPFRAMAASMRWPPPSGVARPR